ncbi:hypothetical protein [Trueperella sp. LYQ143]
MVIVSLRRIRYFWRAKVAVLGFLRWNGKDLFADDSAKFRTRPVDDTRR